MIAILLAGKSDTITIQKYCIDTTKTKKGVLSKQYTLIHSERARDGGQLMFIEFVYKTKEHFFRAQSSIIDLY